MVTCFASIPALLSRVQLYPTFCDVVSESLTLGYAKTAYALFNATCGNVWRECKRNGDKCAWELFKGYVNKYLHENGELPSDRVITFSWVGCFC